MSKKNLYLGGILIALAFVAYLYNGPLQKWQEDKNKSENFLAKIDVNQIDFIDIANKGELITLEKQNDKWKVSGTKDFFVESALATELDTKIKDAINGKMELVSNNKENKKDFDLDEKSGVLIKLRQGENTLKEFLVGGFGSDYNSTYIAEAESDESYLINVALNNIFANSEWYDKTIFQTNPEKITKIRFQYPDREIIIERDGEDWNGIAPYEFSADAEKVGNVLNVIANLEAGDIPEQKFEGTRLEENLIIVEASGEGTNNTIMIGGAESEEDDASYYAKKGDSDNIYLISLENRDILDVSIRDLR
ncbi:DUF4340 domain-containing protein [Candidatus Parcubacteria bacterium]|nr:DUF4340 domain-containing protein [Candidatus Parcubacteria bacterium]